MINEKKKVALVSLVAAVFLTGFNLVIGILTGSLDKAPQEILNRVEKILRTYNEVMQFHGLKIRTGIKKLQF